MRGATGVELVFELIMVEDRPSHRGRETQDGFALFHVMQILRSDDQAETLTADVGFDFFRIPQPLGRQAGHDKRLIKDITAGEDRKDRVFGQNVAPRRAHGGQNFIAG